MAINLINFLLQLITRILTELKVNRLISSKKNQKMISLVKINIEKHQWSIKMKQNGIKYGVKPKNPLSFMRSMLKNAKMLQRTSYNS